MVKTLKCLSVDSGNPRRKIQKNDRNKERAKTGVAKEKKVPKKKEANSEIVILSKPSSTLEGAMDGKRPGRKGD